VKEPKVPQIVTGRAQKGKKLREAQKEEAGKGRRLGYCHEMETRRNEATKKIATARHSS